MPEAPGPNIALLVEQHDRRKAELLCDALGLPQLSVTDGSLPGNTAVAVSLGPALPRADAEKGWRLARGRRLPDGLTLELSGRSTPSAELPAERSMLTAPIRRDDRSDLENAAELTLYYCLKRAEKLPPASACDERDDLRVLSLALRRFGPFSWKGIISIVEGLLGDWRNPNLTEPPPPRTWKDLLCGRIGEEARNCRALYLAVQKRPAAVVAYLEEGILRRFRVKTVRFRASSDAWTKARVLAAVGLVGWWTRDSQLRRAVLQRLLSEEFLDRRTGCLRVAPGAGGYAFSGMVAALLLLEARRANRRFRPVPYDRQRRKMQWEGFAGEDLSLTAAGPRRAHGLLDLQRRRISRSLLENWLSLQAVPSLHGRQYEISNDDYSQATANVEAAWRDVFRLVAQQAGLPLVRLLPWPVGHSWALSLRYDVDRPVSPQQVKRIRAIQRDLISAECGSWYFLPGGPQPTDIDPPPQQWGQEVGVHALRATEARAGEGMTCHSAQMSEYWRGLETLRGAEEASAAYAEHLSGGLLLPRPAWLESDSRPSRIPLTPIHFPLEGSTQDTTLDYFDRQLDAFRRRRARGGHVIIGTHPDLNQELLAQLIDREGIDGAWAVPVGKAVDRCRRIFARGAVEVVAVSTDGVTLRAREDIPALAGQVWLPGQDEPLGFGVDLSADETVTVSLNRPPDSTG